MNDPEAEIKWAGRVPQRTIKCLYETDANGIYDEELIDEVGWALYARCDSFVVATGAWSGRARCHGCGETLWRTDPQPDGSDMLRCEKCGWGVAWRTYFRSIQHKQLSGARTVVAFFQEFMARFPAAEGPRRKMLLIDWLIHRFHSENRDPTRPVGVNLIEGEMNEVIAFLDRLTYGEGSTEGARERHAAWRSCISDTLQRWGGRCIDSEAP
jgi:predicted RNA-binding Zn-ribbon protein involved in translation (DUF1610 family)